MSSDTIPVTNPSSEPSTMSGNLEGIPTALLSNAARGGPTSKFTKRKGCVLSWSLLEERRSRSCKLRTGLSRSSRLGE